ncbi:hypothetical protein RFI_22857 [Reticulomyxa filosa]|uniref:Flavodoxin-like domain-containing protein n=1 Tax=Reticulomyxa filosa TaxID=46433 RepID=X6MM35_RETFI|nr:hypothetical protein RFI_22857 [Reticulomyxa filosa]|eukprot:ETO14497.1 hypothetical protein RFI_22857 [Reticulomyxa filosa]
MAIEVADGLKEAGCEVHIKQVPETLSEEVLKKMYAVDQKSAKDHPLAKVEELPDYDGFMFGIPTRYGTMPAQWKAFWDATGGLWQKGALVGKPAGIFFSTSTLGGGQETTALTTLTALTHHGLLFVPLGYTTPDLMNLSEVHGGRFVTLLKTFSFFFVGKERETLLLTAPYGAGTLSGTDGKRQPSDLEKRVARHHGAHVGHVIAALFNGKGK